MDNKEFKALQKKVLRTKKDLKEWESVFAKKHGRPPTIKDISDRPDIEKFYKKYNQLKRTLKQETEALQNDSQSSVCSSPHNDTQQTVDSNTSTQPTAANRRNSVEFIRSPSNHMNRTKPFFDTKQQQLSVRRLSELEEMKSALASSTSTAGNQRNLNRQLTEDEAFWLDVPSKNDFGTIKSLSQPTTPSSFNFSQQSQTTKRLVLGSSQPLKKKNTLRQQKLFGRLSQNPFQRAISSSQELLHPCDDSLPPTTTTATTTTLPPSSQQQSQPYTDDDDEDDDMEGIEIVNHEVNPFRNYDPSLFHWEDPTFSVGPGFFSSEKASSCFLVPILKEPTRRDRVLRKLAKGTLGEVLEENQHMEEDLDEDIREFISTNSRIDPNSFEAALTPIDENMLNQKEYTYKKKPIQKRQTKLYKMKFVDTSSSH